MSVLRLVLVLCVVALFLPSTPEEKQQAYRGISEAVQQVRTFCVRNDSLCENGKFVAAAIADRVRYGAEMLIEAATGGADEGAASARSRPEGATFESRRRSSAERSYDTLRQEDRAPSWRGPGTS